MCGIIGYSGTSDASEVLLSGLRSLEYRGYDSAGLAVFDGDTLAVIKTKGRIDDLASKLGAAYPSLSSFCGIGHTRWATHGAPSDLNSHPHGTPRVYLVHNGIIENHREIRMDLAEKGCTFTSDTDTEAAALLLDHEYEQCGDPLLALGRMTQRLTGSYAIAAVFADHPGKVFALRKESPLLAAMAENGCFVASDIPAFLSYTNRYIRLEEGEIAIVQANDITVVKDGETVEKTIETADFTAEAAEKGGYAHFMLKEIHEEPEALINTVRPLITNGMPDFTPFDLPDVRLRSLEHIRIVACGTAMHAGLIGKYAVESLARVPVTVDIASEFRYANPILGRNDLVLVISQSGETADTLAALRLAKSHDVRTAAIVNVVGSTVAREADSVIYTHAGPEIAVASTKAYTVQLGVLYLLALRVAYARGMMEGKTVRSLAAELLDEVPGVLRQTLSLEKYCRKVAKYAKDYERIFFVGRGADYYTAMEAALKMKEISYIHCEAYAAGEMKHGTISLITRDTLVVSLNNYEKLKEKMDSNNRELITRGAYVVNICRLGTKVEPHVFCDTLRVPNVSDLYVPIVAATVMQLLAYYTALERGNDIDKPRNLAKSVTVE